MGQEHSSPKDTPAIPAPMQCTHCGGPTEQCDGGRRCPKCCLRWEVVELRSFVAPPVVHQIPHYGHKHFKVPHGMACRSTDPHAKYTTDPARATCLECRRAITRMRRSGEEAAIRLKRLCRHCKNSINICGAQRYCYDLRRLVNELDSCEHFEY